MLSKYTAGKEVIIDVMGKSQQAGIREIFIMQIEMRIQQSICERISWVVCKHMGNETMTVPSLKELSPKTAGGGWQRPVLDL
jgi:hypothetical protein